MKKRGSIEMSIGTIVVIVLSMSMLILGLVLIRGIFSGATDITEMTSNQLNDQVSKLFGKDKKLSVYPDTNSIEIKAGEKGAFAIRIKNLLKGFESGEKKFSYEIGIADLGNCNIEEERLLGLITTGGSFLPTSVATGGEPIVRKVSLEIPEGFPLCSFSYKIESFYDETQTYATEFMDVSINA